MLSVLMTPGGRFGPTTKPRLKFPESVKLHPLYRVWTIERLASLGTDLTSPYSMTRTFLVLSRVHLVETPPQHGNLVRFVGSVGPYPYEKGLAWQMGVSWGVLKCSPMQGAGMVGSTIVFHGCD